MNLLHKQQSTFETNTSKNYNQNNTIDADSKPQSQPRSFTRSHSAPLRRCFFARDFNLTDCPIILYN